jgi:ubiquinone/menaquinone biosynthesis C-methylase UbiE
MEKKNLQNHHQQQQQDIKKEIRKTYSKIALQGDTNEPGTSSCCGPTCCSGENGAVVGSPTQAAAVVGYGASELESVPQASILGVGCGAPVKFADLQKGETVVDLGSGGGIDVFLSANKVSDTGKVIGIDMTDEMLERAKRNAKEGGYTNVDFRKGDIENRIPVDENSVDVVISNCVINLTVNKVDTFREIYRILKQGGSGRMVISDLVTDTEIAPADADTERWCGCIDGALTKEHYLDSIRQAGFQNVEVLSEQLYLDDDSNPRNGESEKRISSVVIKAVK